MWGAKKTERKVSKIRKENCYVTNLKCRSIRWNEISTFFFKHEAIESTVCNTSGNNSTKGTVKQAMNRRGSLRRLSRQWRLEIFYRFSEPHLQDSDSGRSACLCHQQLRLIEQNTFLMATNATPFTCYIKLLINVIHWKHLEAHERGNFHPFSLFSKNADEILKYQLCNERTLEVNELKSWKEEEKNLKFTVLLWFKRSLNGFHSKL